MKLLVQRSLIVSFLLSLFFSLNAFAADYYWVGGTGNWSELSHWATTSGGSTLHTILPGQTDDVFFDANSFSADGQTVNVDRPLVRMHDFIAQAVAYNVTISGEASLPDFEIYGSMDIPANVTLEWPGVLLDFNADVAGQTVNIANGVLNTSEDASIRFSGEGSWTLESGLSAIALFVTQGEVIFGANEFNFKSVYLWYSFDKILNLTDATLNIEKWQISSLESFVTIIPNNSTINVNDEFQGKGKTYGTVNVITPTGYVKDVEITGSNTYQDFNVAQEVNLLVESGTTQTVLGNINFNGAASTPITFEASTAGEKFFFDGAGINISGDYVNISESDFLGTATFALENSLLIGDVSGWEINSVPKPTDNGSFYYSKIYSDSLYIHLSPGNGAERIVFMREATFPNVTVADDVAYTADQTFGAGTSVGTDTYVVYQGSDDLVKIDGLNPNTTYYISLLDVNSTPDNSSIKYVNTTTSFAKSASTIASGNIYMNTDAITVNGGEQFYDDGGNGFYFSNQEHVLTLNSAVAGKSVKLTFSELDLRSYEQLRIFDGADTTATLLNSLSGSSNSLPLTVSSTGEALTLKFYSADFDDSPFGLDGWVADVEVYLPAPTQASSGINVTAFTDTSIEFTFNPGNGSSRLITIGAINYSNPTSPQSNTAYTVNTEYGLGHYFGNNVYAIASGDINSVAVTGLPNVGGYRVRIYEYNEVNGEISYSANIYQPQVRNDLEPPTAMTESFIFQKDEYPLRTHTTIENGSFFYISYNEYRKRLTLASTEPIDTIALKNALVDDLVINTGDYGLGDEILPKVFAVDKSGIQSRTTMSGFSPGVKYYFAYVILNENAVGTRYGTNQIALDDFETIAADEFILGEEGTISQEARVYDPFVLSFDNRTAIGTTTHTFYPTDANKKLGFIIDYLNLDSFQKFDFKIFDGETTSAPLLVHYERNVTTPAEILATNPQGALTFEYTINSGSFNSYRMPFGFYGTIFLQNNLEAPATKVSQVQVNNVTKVNADISWKRGNGDKVLMVLNSTGINSFKPVNGVRYEFNQKLINGQKIAYLGTGENLSLDDLVPDTEYRIDFYEFYEGNDGTAYGEVNQTSFTTVSNRPTVPTTNLRYDVLNDQEIKLKWKSGNGERRMVIAFDNGFFTPNNSDFDGKMVPAGDTNFSEGQSFRHSSGVAYRVLYVGTGDSVVIQGINDNRTYYWTVLEINGDNRLTNVLYNNYSEFGLYPEFPTNQASNLELKDPTANTVSMKWDVPSNGSQIVFFTKNENDELPSQLVANEEDILNYKSGSGSIVYTRRYQAAEDYVKVKGLEPQTTYYVKVYYASKRADSYSLNLNNPANGSFTTTAYQDFYWVDGYGDWDDKTHWATTSGGSIKHDTIPHFESIVHIDQNSFTDTDIHQLNLVENINAQEINISYNKQLLKLSTYDSINQRERSITWQVQSSLNFSDSVSFTGNYFNIHFYGKSEINEIYLPLNFVNGELDYMYFQGLSKDHVYMIHSIPETIGTLNIDNIKVNFESTEKLRIKNSLNVASSAELLEVPNNIEIGRTLNSNGQFKKVTRPASASSPLNIFGNPTIDSLSLQGTDLQINSEATLTVNHIINNGAWKIYSGVRGQQGYIATNSDSLIVEDVEITDNHAVGGNVYIAKKSLLFDNVEGWVTDSIKAPSAPVRPSQVYLTYGDSTHVEIGWKSLTMGHPVLLVWENRSNYKRPLDNTSYNYATELEKADTLGLARIIDLKGRNKLPLQGLKPNTNYTIELYAYNQYDTMLTYNYVPASLEFRTSTGNDAFFTEEYDPIKTIIARGQNLYAAEGIGYTQSNAENRFPIQYLELEPIDGSKKVMIKQDESGNSVMRMSIYTSEAQEFLGDYLYYSEELKAGIVAPVAGEGIKITLKKAGQSSANSIGPRYSIYSVNGELANQPANAVENFRATTVSDSTIDLSWDGNAGEKVLIVASKMSNVLFEPQNYITYQANSTFNQSAIRSNQNEYIVFAGEDKQVTIGGLEPDTEYSFKAYTYNDSESLDPNYYVEEYVSLSLRTRVMAPVTNLSYFNIMEVKSNELAFDFGGYEANQIMVVASQTRDFDYIPSDSLAFNSAYNTSIGFSNATEVASDIKILFVGNLQDVSYESDGFIEGQTYYLKFYAFNSDYGMSRFQKDAIGYDSITTLDASFEINSLSEEIVCPSSAIVINYGYTGTNYNNQDRKVIYSQSVGMNSPLELNIIDSAEFQFTVELPADVEDGTYYISVIPTDGNFDLYNTKIEIMSGVASIISRLDMLLVSNGTEYSKWYLNNVLITNSNNVDTLTIEEAGMYHQIKYVANCEYKSNAVLVKPIIDIIPSAIEICIGDMLTVSYENMLGLAPDTLSYQAVLNSTSTGAKFINIDNADFENNQFTFTLPADLVAGDYSLTFNTTNDQIESDTAILTVEQFEEPIITMADGQLSSSYAEGNQWYFNGEPIVGATEQIYTPKKSGNYLLEVEAGTCLLTASVEYDILLAQKSAFEAVGLKAYPNPAKDYLNITYQGNQLAHSNITVLDAKGQKITDYQLNFTTENGLMLDVSNYPAGLYFLTVKSGQLRAVHRFVKR